jgi:fatty-acyl-CoA synthase
MNAPASGTAPELSYAKGSQSKPLLVDTIGDNFMKAVAAFPRHEALVDKATDRRWAYAELSRDVDIVALGLLALGVRAGDRVGIWAPNCPEWVLVQYGTARIGAILVNINPAYRAHELSFVMPACHCRRARIQGCKLHRHDRDGPGRLPQPRRCCFHRRAIVDRLDEAG